MAGHVVVMNLLSLLLWVLGCHAVSVGTYTLVSSFKVPQSPSGMYYYAPEEVLYVLCGTNTNGENYLYAFSAAGVQQCAITIPTAVGINSPNNPDN